jgi:hypothetical protein
VKRIFTVMAAFLVGCAAKIPPPLAIPPHDLTRPVRESTEVTIVISDARAAHDAADHYIFSAASTSEGIEAVRGLTGGMRAEVRQMRAHPTLGNIAAAEAAVGRVREWLALHH